MSSKESLFIAVAALCVASASASSHSNGLHVRTQKNKFNLGFSVFLPLQDESSSSCFLHSAEMCLEQGEGWAAGEIHTRCKRFDREMF